MANDKLEKLQAAKAKQLEEMKKQKAGGAEKPDIQLMVLDIDNTVADFFNAWGETMGMAVEKLAESRGIKTDDLYKDIKENVSGAARFNPNISYLVKECPSLQPKTPEEKKKFAKDDARIIHDINKLRIKADTPYKGVMEQLKKAKENGTKVVFYTDALMSVAAGRLANMGMPLDTVDGLYARGQKTGEYDEPPLQVKSKVLKYFDNLRSKLGGKMDFTNGWKPSKEQMNVIMKAQGITDPKKVLMVGDNVKSDGGGAVQAGCYYAWQKHGSVVSKRAEEVYMHLNDKPGYGVGPKAHLAQMNDENRPHFVLENGFKDLEKSVNFTKAPEQSRASRMAKLAEKHKQVKRLSSKKKAEKDVMWQNTIRHLHGRQN